MNLGRVVSTTALVATCLLALVSVRARAQAPETCVNIFYDRGPAGYWMGRTYALFLQNLLGHFPELQQIVSPIELYERGDTERCRATIYLGSYFDNEIPQAFFDDFVRTKHRVAWLGYSIWKVDLESLFGHQYQSLTKLDLNSLDREGKPGFFRFIDYKGETFFKFGEWSRTDNNKFLAGFEQTELKETKTGVAETLAWARHSISGRRIPYAIRAQNRFYVADIPFSFMHESDRYLIFCDLLFDILDLPPRETERIAFVRMEDVHALSPLVDVLNMVKVFEAEQVPVNISLIPIFYDPLYVFLRTPREEYVTMERKPEFLAAVHEFRDKQHSFIWHGVTHQYYLKPNPHDGVSGSDFEFWDANRNAPVERDSVNWVLDRLHDGLATILRAGLPAPRAWLTPHYQASVLDYLIFARVFPWNVGRVIYFNFRASGLPQVAESELWLERYDLEIQRRRKEAFAPVRIEIDPAAPWNGQFFPYVIEGDVYGQRLIPENLGNSQPYISDHVVRTRTPQDIVADAKRNLVIRDAWASFFYHPFLLQHYRDGGRGTFPGDAQELVHVLREIKRLGYRFVAADEITQRIRPIRPEPIYRGTRP